MANEARRGRVVGLLHNIFVRRRTSSALRSRSRFRLLSRIGQGFFAWEGRLLAAANLASAASCSAIHALAAAPVGKPRMERNLLALITSTP